MFPASHAKLDCFKPQSRKKVFSLNDSNNHSKATAAAEEENGSIRFHHQKKEKEEEKRKQTEQLLAAQNNRKAGVIAGSSETIALFSKKNADSGTRSTSKIKASSLMNDKIKSAAAAAAAKKHQKALPIQDSGADTTAGQASTLAFSSSASAPTSPALKSQSGAGTKCTDGGSFMNRNGFGLGGGQPVASSSQGLLKSTNRSSSYNANGQTTGSSSIFRNSPLNIINKNFNMNRLNFINNRAFVTNKQQQ